MGIWEVRSGVGSGKVSWMTIRLAVEGVAAISLVFPAGFLAISLESICVLIINWIYARVTVRRLVGGDQKHTGEWFST